jgi:hypothetical protein
MPFFYPHKLKKSIRFKLVGFFTGLILFSIAVISVFQFYESKRILQSRILSDLSVLVKSRQGEIINFLEGYVKLVLSNSSRRLSRIYMVKLKDNDPGAEAAKIEGLRTLHDMQVSDNRIEKIDLLDLSGKVVISTDSGRVGKDLSRTDLFLEGSDGVTVGNVYLINGILTIDVAVPIFDPFKENMEKIGVFQASLDVTQLFDILNDYQGLGNTGEVHVARLNGKDIEFISLLRHYNSAPLSFKVSLSSDIAMPMKKALSHNSGVMVGSDYRGKQVLSAYDYISLTGWGIVGKIDVAEVFIPIRNLFVKNLIVGGVY